MQPPSVSIAKNTFLLYIRLVITIFIAFFTQRVVLEALGVDNYGIYNVVGGLTTIISILNAGMIQASQRFFAYEIGKGKKSDLKNVFRTSLTIHLIISIIILFLAEFVGIWFLNTQMNIPQERMLAANSVFQASVCVLILTVLMVPFDALIISKEDFGIYAFISILEYVLKLFIAYLIYSIEYFDRLIIYGWALFGVALVCKSILFIFSNKRYEECICKLNKDGQNIRKMLSFAGFSFIGNIGFVLRNQVVNIIINIFFGAAINAARGIAYQVSSQLSSFAGNFQMAAIPQITKSFAHEDLERMRTLIYKSSKYSFCLLFLLALPVAIYPIPLLDFWLGNPPLYSDKFLQLAIIVALLDSMAIPLGKGIDATGRNKFFQVGICLIMCLDIPLAVLIYKLGAQCYEIMLISIMTSFLGLLFRLIVLSNYVKCITISSFMKIVMFPCLIAIIIDTALAHYILELFLSPSSLLMYLAYVIIVCILSALTIYFICLEHTEKIRVNKVMRKICHIS